MSTFKERLIAEEKELVERCEKLHAFIETSPVFKTLGEFDQYLLKSQYITMTEYADILSLRIERLGA